MKRIVSVSIGSSKRNHKAEANFLGEQFIIERIGTDGDKEKAIALIKELDGKVAAFGMGGIDIYVGFGDKKYILKDALPLKKAAKISPIVDGVGLKNTLERRVVHQLMEKRPEILKGKKVIVTSAMDRFGMTEALVEEGLDVSSGDLLCVLGIPKVIKRYTTLISLAKVVAPIVVRLPFEWLYPTGEKQNKTKSNKHAKAFEPFDVIAGDFLYIKKFMPDDLTGKVIITNTVTKENVEDMKRRGLQYLVTTTPEFDGRSFGTNVMEALLVSIINKPQNEITEEDYLNIMDQLNFQPRIEQFYE